MRFAGSLGLNWCWLLDGPAALCRLNTAVHSAPPQGAGLFGLQSFSPDKSELFKLKFELGSLLLWLCIDFLCSFHLRSAQINFLLESFFLILSSVFIVDVTGVLLTLWKAVKHK